MDAEGMGRRLRDAAGHGDIALVAELLAKGASLGADRTGFTALMKAIHRRSMPCLELLMPVSDLSVGDAHGVTPLMWACACGWVEGARALAAAGGRGACSAVDEDGRDALMWACLNQQHRCVWEVAFLSDLSARDGLGLRALDLAKASKCAMTWDAVAGEMARLEGVEISPSCEPAEGVGKGGRL